MSSPGYGNASTGCAMYEIYKKIIEKYNKYHLQIFQNNDKILCDKTWQIEAITNIIKNAVDHSLNDSKVIIDVSSNNVYSMIEIKNFGDVIDKDDIKHIFERFYKGKNATSDSIGIGLSLSKTIIEEDNGNISVNSNKEETIFTIKYFKI